jgi:hypothetical protein
MIPVRHAGVLAVALCSVLVACIGSGRWPKLTEGGRYEVHNPTGCRARVYTATEKNVTREYLGDVPTGGRAVFTVPPRSEGTRVVAMALYRDGTDCDVEGKLRVRAVKP